MTCKERSKYATYTEKKQPTENVPEGDPDFGQRLYLNQPL